MIYHPQFLYIHPSILLTSPPQPHVFFQQTLAAPEVLLCKQRLAVETRT